MTREEQLACLNDRPCEVCKFHKENGCERWACVFEEEPEDAGEALRDLDEDTVKAWCKARNICLVTAEYLRSLLK